MFAVVVTFKDQKAGQMDRFMPLMLENARASVARTNPSAISSTSAPTQTNPAPCFSTKSIPVSPVLMRTARRRTTSGSTVRSGR